MRLTIARAFKKETQCSQEYGDEAFRRTVVAGLWLASEPVGEKPIERQPRLFDMRQSERCPLPETIPVGDEFYHRQASELGNVDCRSLPQS